MVEFVWLRILAMVALCVLLLRLVMRGKWVAWSHPVCSACGFNLYGLPETSDRCPECGGELAKVRKNAVWRRRWMSLVLALGLIGGSLCLVYPVAYRSAYRGLNYLPSGILLHFKNNLRVMDILQSRLDAGQLSQEQESAVLERMAQGWSPIGDWAGEIEGRHKSGQLPAKIWKLHAAEALKVPILMRTTVARGDPLVIRVGVGEFQTVLSMRYRLRVKLDGREVPGDYRQQVHRLRLGPGLDMPTYLLIPLPEDFAKGLRDGRHSVTAMMAEAMEGEKVIAKRTLAVQGSIKLLPEGRASVKLVLPQSLPIKPFATGFSGKDLTIYRDGSCPDFKVPFFKATNIGYCYQLLVRQDGREIPLGEMILYSKSRNKIDWAWWPATPLPEIHGDRVDVIFRPDPKLGTKTIWIMQVVNKQFIVKGAIVK